MANERTFLIDYSYQGDRYSITLVAKSHQEAEARLKCIGRGKVAGEVGLVVPYELMWPVKAWMIAQQKFKQVIQGLRPGSGE